MAGIDIPGRYERPEPIGAGAMGTVYRAFDRELQRPVAIKVLSDRFAANVEIRERFRREARTAARLSGASHVVGVLDFGTAGTRPFIVFEYLGGGSLADRLTQGRPPTADALSWIDQAAKALDAAHARGVLHRDVKPGNLLFDETGNVHITDFGIARATDDASLTSTGTLLGSAGYLSPEQARGEPATEASDLYALAVVAFELFAGRRPFERESATAEVLAHAHAPPPAISRMRGGPPSGLDHVFERALAKDPARRYVSGAAFAEALREAIAGAAETIPLGATAVIPAAASPRRRGAVAGAIAVALAAAGTAAGFGLGADDSHRAAPTRRVTVVKTVTQTLRSSPRLARIPAAPVGPPQLISAGKKHAGKHGKGHGHRHGHDPKRDRGR
jgi:serine/threonine-protein kinase